MANDSGFFFSGTGNGLGNGAGSSGLIPDVIDFVPVDDFLPSPGPLDSRGVYTLPNLTSGNLTDMTSGSDVTGRKGSPNVSVPAIVSISCIFCTIGLVGIVGNTLVILIILTDKKMRHSVTNLFIMNLALSDLFIMLGGIPETVQFMLNRGWLLGEVACKAERYVLVLSLYSSVITLVAVCVERYIAIVHPMKAHLYCSRKRMMAVIASIWPVVFTLGLPVLLYNRLRASGPSAPAFCVLHFPGNHIRYLMIFKFIESGLFYMIPMLLQIVCYSIIGKHLFAGSKELHRNHVTINKDGVHRERHSDTMKQRIGVVKMLIASVIIYFVSYSPHQVLLFYNTFSHAPFHQTWPFLVFVTAMGYINSAANPILYCIFSQKFRQKFKIIFQGRCLRGETQKNGRIQLKTHSVTDSGVSNAHAHGHGRKYMYVRVSTNTVPGSPL